MPCPKSIGRNRGFTMVELLVVMAIMAALALVAIPWFFKIAQRNQLKSAAREIQTTLLAARMKAVRRNQPVSVVISSVTPPIEFLTIEPNPPAPTPTRAPQRLELPAKAAILWATPEAPGGTVAFGGDGRLVSPPPAPTPGVFYTLQGPVGAGAPNQITISVDSNGRVAVVTPTNWQ